MYIQGGFSSMYVTEEEIVLTSPDLSLRIGVQVESSNDAKVISTSPKREIEIGMWGIVHIYDRSICKDDLQLQI